MNMFEQFGIKEVADVVIYAIDLDKYDDEVYIPIMYLDTLKVSTLEQSASQTAAKGGNGNADLIVWDFGKEITLSLQDALFTPASQSLMWGGKYGIKKPKIYGVWNPYVYPTDSAGRPQYIQRIALGPTYVLTVEDGWNMYVSGYSNDNAKFLHMYPDYFKDIWAINPPVMPYFLEKLTVTGVAAHTVTFDGEDYDGFIISGQNPDLIPSDITITCFMDNNQLQMYFGIDDWHTAVSLADATDTYSFICPCDTERKFFLIIQNDGRYMYDRDGIGKEDQLTITEYNCPSDNIINESEEIQRAIGKYTIAANELDNPSAWTNGQRPEMATLNIDKFGKFDYAAYEFVSSGNPEDTACYYHDIDLCDESLIKCTDEQIDAYGYTWSDTSISINSLEGTQDMQYIDSADIRYRIRKDNGLREIAVEYHSDSGNNYQPKIDVYRNIKQKYIDDRGFEQYYTTKVLVGSFYIIDDWNLDESVPQDFAYLIDSGINNTKMLEKMSKFQAKQTFAIDTDKNLRSSNYRYDNDYANTPLTVFINPRTMQPYESNADSYTTKDGLYLEGNFTIIKQGDIYYKWTRTISDEYTSLGNQIIVDAQHFPGTYKVVGETYVRSRLDGQDQRYQFEIPLCKLSADTSIVLEAAGDPTTFGMNFKVLRKDDGTMVKLTQYNVTTDPATGTEEIVPTSKVPEEEVPVWTDNGGGEPPHLVVGGYRAIAGPTRLSIINPTNNTTEFTDSEVDAPLDGSGEGHITQITDEELGRIVANEPYTYGDSISIPNEFLVSGAQEIIDSTMTEKTIVKAITDYSIEQETHMETAEGEIVPGTSEWNQIDAVESNKFLRENEYEITAEENNQEV